MAEPNVVCLGGYGGIQNYANPPAAARAAPLQKMTPLAS